MLQLACRFAVSNDV